MALSDLLFGRWANACRADTSDNLETHETASRAIDGNQLHASAVATAQTCGFGAELLPFVPRAGWPRGLQGFVRLANTWDTAALVNFVATDDAGNAYELAVRVEPSATTHFNSEDLELGNTDKGTRRHRHGSGGTGERAFPSVPMA